MKTTAPPPKSGNDKHGLHDIGFGKHKDYKTALYNTIRLAAWYHGQKLNCKFVTRKMHNEDGKPVIRVFREKIA